MKAQGIGFRLPRLPILLASSTAGKELKNIPFATITPIVGAIVVANLFSSAPPLATDECKEEGFFRFIPALLRVIPGIFSADVLHSI
eukprot:CAMPEP_0197315468 /NCGR_PEP_ID=MMETSP0891-20130614/38398_1 /TAXON_ID=44058 ORGANISM="Aureoumbra lagunensis, Strain CCMP1510" /NCGR_SAMPLE_ID=MMETSP0891 /ASSEMBLY_ACC=CAM_ASM_000534 /LENGTH=86 /DNA_ID=CAMNT_0042804435 /DNA_START=629 /DNA_END=886 /DNA_ORIENTATION=+